MLVVLGALQMHGRGQELDVKSMSKTLEANGGKVLYYVCHDLRSSQRSVPPFVLGNGLLLTDPDTNKVVDLYLE